MADWFDIPDTAIDPDAPLTSQLAYAWRDNCIAIAGGASGAPRVQESAIGSWFTTLGGEKTYAFLAMEVPNGTSVAAGDTRSGSVLRYAGEGPSGVVYSGTPSGTWRLMGYLTNTTGADVYMSSLWVRIS